MNTNYFECQLDFLFFNLMMIEGMRAATAAIIERPEIIIDTVINIINTDSLLLTLPTRVMWYRYT